MEKRIYGKIGLALIIIGILVINLKSFLIITGGVVGVSTAVSRVSFWVGLVFIIGGFVLVMFQFRRGGIERIIRSKTFIDDTKRLRGPELKAVENAIEKIKKGLAKQEKLKYGRGYSARVDKGARIVYGLVGGDALLQRYIPSSKHKGYAA